MAHNPKGVADNRGALGARLAGLRAAAGYTQETFAPLTYYGRSSIANIETGRQTASRDFWVRCDALLGTGGLLTAEHDRQTARRQQEQLATARDATRYLPVAAIMAGPAAAPVDTLLAQVTAVANACGLSVSTTQNGRRRIAVTDVARLKAITDLYLSIDRERGGGLLCRQLAEVAEAATIWLDPRRAIVETNSRSLLASAVADVRMMAGWTAFDAGFYEDSQRHFVLAERAAIHANDPLRAARVRYCQARQLQHRHHNIDALHTLQFAREDLGATATPALLTMLLGAEAASLAALGRRSDALDCLQQASDAFAAISRDHEPTWMQYYDAGELFAQYGRVYRDLARQGREEHRPQVHAADHDYGAQAVHWVRKALEAFDPGNARSILLNQVGLCSALMLADDPDQALSVGAQLMSDPGTVSSRRVTERIQNLHRDFGAHQQRSDVATFARMITDGEPVR